jgi:hypothetical protein
MFLDIHIEKCDDKGKGLWGIIKSGKPFGLSVVPVLLTPDHYAFWEGIYPRDYCYSKEMVRALRECVKNPNITVGQQGYLHYCPDCFEIREKRDPWHENRCLYGKEKSVEEQMGIMELGKKVIEDFLHVTPTMYVAPNHQFDSNTKEAARKMGYRYFVERAVINVPPYEDDGLVVVPERKPGQRGEIFYVHYDQIADDIGRCFGIIMASAPLEAHTPKKRRSLKAHINSRLSIARKRLRDLRNKL